MNILYDELRALAKRELDGERPDHTLSATALVHEAFLKLGGAYVVPAESDTSRRPLPIDRAVFFGLAAQAMRRILIDHARGKRRIKRGGGRPRASSGLISLLPDPNRHMGSLDALALDEALKRLAVEHEQAAQVVELRFFAGLTDQMIGEVMQINERTVRRHWAFARAWLAREMGDAQPKA